MRCQSAIQYFAPLTVGNVQLANKRIMVTLRNDGMTKVLNGTTSIDEILRVVV